MKETIKKSIIGGITFFLTVMLLYVVYAVFTFDQPDSVGTGSGLTVTNWNKVVNSIGYLKGKTDSLQTTVDSNASQILALSSAGPCPSGKIMVSFGNMSACIKDNISVTVGTVGFAKIEGGIVKTRVYGTPMGCDSGRIIGNSATCSFTFITTTTYLLIANSSGICLYSNGTLSGNCASW